MGWRTAAGSKPATASFTRSRGSNTSARATVGSMSRSWSTRSWNGPASNASRGGRGSTDRRNSTTAAWASATAVSTSTSMPSRICWRVACSSVRTGSRSRASTGAHAASSSALRSSGRRALGTAPSRSAAVSMIPDDTSKAGASWAARRASATAPTPVVSVCCRSARPRSRRRVATPSRAVWMAVATSLRAVCTGVMASMAAWPAVWMAPWATPITSPSVATASATGSSSWRRASWTAVRSMASRAVRTVEKAAWAAVVTSTAARSSSSTGASTVSRRRVMGRAREAGSRAAAAVTRGAAIARQPVDYRAGAGRGRHRQGEDGGDPPGRGPGQDTDLGQGALGQEEGGHLELGRGPGQVGVDEGGLPEGEAPDDHVGQLVEGVGVGRHRGQDDLDAQQVVGVDAGEQVGQAGAGDRPQLGHQGGQAGGVEHPGHQGRLALDVGADRSRRPSARPPAGPATPGPRRGRRGAPPGSRGRSRGGPARSGRARR